MRRWRLTAVVLASLVLGAGCAWTTTRFDPARTADNPRSGVSSSTVGTLRAAWSVPRTYQFPGPGLIADGVVVTAYAGQLTAYDAQDGSVLWGGAFGPAAIVGDTLYSTRSDTADGALVALDVRSGAQRWSVAGTGGAVSSADDHTVFIGDSYGGEHGAPEYLTLEAWDVGTHKLRWTENFSGEPAVAGGVVYSYRNFSASGVDVAELVADDESTGQRIWTAPDARRCFNAPGPVVSGGYLYANGETRRASDGSLIRSWPDGCSSTDIAADGRTVFATSGTTSSDGRVTAFDGVTGTVRWSAPASTAPTLADDLVLVGTPSAVVAYTASTGRPVWFTGLHDGALSYPIAADGMLVVSTDIPDAGFQVFRTHSS